MIWPNRILSTLFIGRPIRPMRQKTKYFVFNGICDHRNCRIYVGHKVRVSLKSVVIFVFISWRFSVTVFLWCGEFQIGHSSRTTCVHEILFYIRKKSPKVQQWTSNFIWKSQKNYVKRLGKEGRRIGKMVLGCYITRMHRPKFHHHLIFTWPSFKWFCFVYQIKINAQWMSNNWWYCTKYAKQC